jgi:hypothetical protein
MTMDRHLVAPSTTLVDILDRVLDKGLVVAGDIRVSLANVELLTIQVRLVVCSIDKAQEIGLDWWRRDGFLTSGVNSDGNHQNAALRARIDALEAQVTALTDAAPPRPAPRARRRAARPIEAETGGTHGG